MVQDLENTSAFLLPRLHKYNLNQRNIWVFFSSRTFSCIPFKYTGYLIRNLSSKLVNKFYNEILLEEDDALFNKQLTEGVFIEKDFTKLLLQFEKEIEQEEKEKAEELKLLDNPDPNTISLFDVDPMDFYNLEERYEFSLTNPIYNTLKFEYNALDNFYQYNYSNNVTRELGSVNESGFTRIFSRNQLQLIYFQNISKSK